MLFFIELAIIEERVVKIMRSSIMKKSIIVAIILLILFGTLATLYINNLSDNLYSETDEYLNDLTNQTAKAIKNRINENLTQLTTISLIIQQDGILQEPLLDYLNQLAQRDGVKRFGIADLQGNVVTSDRKVLLIIRMVRQSMFILYQYINIMKLVRFCLLLFIQISYQVFCRLQLIIMLAMHLFLMKMVMLF